MKKISANSASAIGEKSMPNRDNEIKVLLALRESGNSPLTTEQLAVKTGLSPSQANDAAHKLNYFGMAYIYLRGNGGYRRHPAGNRKLADLGL